MNETTPYVPVPTDRGWCTVCVANVQLDEHGSCPVDGVLAIWPQGQYRPNITTATLLALRDGVRIDGPTQQGQRAQPLNVRQLRGAP